MKRLAWLKVTAACVALASVSAFSQIQSATGTDVTLNANVTESLTVSLDVSSVSFTLTPQSDTNPGNGPINATTTWVLADGRTSVSLYAYFDNSAAALTAGASQNIPSSAVSAKVNGVSMGSFTSSASFFSAGSSVTLFTQAITDANRNSSRVSPITLNIDLSSLPQLGAGMYVGTLHLRAEATT